MLKTCEGCLWFDKCQDVGERCEYYEPLYSDDDIAVKEYKQDLKEREIEYRKLVNEQQDIKDEEV